MTWLLISALIPLALGWLLICAHRALSSWWWRLLLSEVAWLAMFFGRVA